MKWFQHQSSANMDAKLQEILLDYGLEGYGLYWYCIELIASNVDKNNLTFILEHDARIIARNTGSTPQKVEEMMRRFCELGLFECSEGIITCLKLSKLSDEYTQKLLRSNPNLTSNLKNVGTKSDKVRSNRIEDNIKEEKIINNTSIPSSELHPNLFDESGDAATCYSFDEFYSDYQKKVDKKKAETKYKKIKESDRQLIKDHVKLYVQSTPNKQYRKSPLVYLNGECWEDEILDSNNQQQQTDHRYNQESTANFF